MKKGTRWKKSSQGSSTVAGKIQESSECTPPESKHLGSSSLSLNLQTEHTRTMFADPQNLPRPKSHSQDHNVNRLVHLATLNPLGGPGPKP